MGSGSTIEGKDALDSKVTDETVSAKKTVVIADDHAIVRQSLSDVLSEPGRITAQGLDIVEQAGDGFAVLAAVKRYKPNLLLLDITMPLASGAEIIKDISRWSPDTCIVVFTGLEATGLLWGLIEDGAQGLFSKADPVENMLDMLPMILEGMPYIAPRFRKLLDQKGAITALTSRERQTLSMVVGGMTNREIAEAMNISPKTVDKHRTSLMNKLNLHSVVELIAFALREGMLDQPHSS